MTSLGVVLCVSGCVSGGIVEAPPVLCPPYGFAEFEDYEALADERLAPSLRAWVRQTEKVCRANEEMYDQ